MTLLLYFIDFYCFWLNIFYFVLQNQSIFPINLPISFDFIFHQKSHLQQLEHWMKINDSQQSKSKISFQPTMKYQSSEEDLSSNKSQNQEKQQPLPSINNNQREIQILLSIGIVILSTLWVQITMQRHAPFVRASQNYFNQIILEHYSQDIYEGADVIYWRTGEYYRYQDIQGVFQRLNDTLYDLNVNSMFVLPQNYNQVSSQVQLLAKYGSPKENRISQIKTYDYSLADFSILLQETFMNRTFYDKLWQTQLQVSIPILYRETNCTLSLKISSELYSSIMMSFKINVDLFDRDQNLVRATYNQDNLGLRKQHDPFDMELSIPYIFWIILFLYIILFGFEFRFIMKKNAEVTHNLREKLRQEKRIQKLLEDINKNQLVIPDFKVNDSSNESKDDENVDLTDQHFPIPARYQLSMLKRAKKIGVYQISELVISFISLITCYNTHNGIICFLAWIKLMVYLTQTKNKYMVGFLLEEAVPIYLKILLNIFLLITAFVLFNCLVYQTTIKFQTLRLGYFQYIFNYFQYGIYQNFILAFQSYGIIAQFFYFIQLIYLLYVGNNILQSVLANQVMKNSYMDTVKEMIDELKTECPACGADPKDQIKESEMFIDGMPKKKSQFISKIIKSNKRQSRNESSIMNNSNYHITVTSPLLSPFFPSKVQKKQSQKFLSPKLKNGNFEKQLKQINKKLQKEQIGKSKIEEIQRLNEKYEDVKMLKLEISQSKIEQRTQDKYLKKIKFKIQLIFTKIDKFNELGKVSSSKRISFTTEDKLSEVKAEVLSNLLQKVQDLKQTISQAIQ